MVDSFKSVAQGVLEIVEQVQGKVEIGLASCLIDSNEVHHRVLEALYEEVHALEPVLCEQKSFAANLALIEPARNSGK